MPAPRISRRFARRWLLALSLAAVVVPAMASTDGIPALEQAHELVVVTSPGWDADHGTLRTFRRDHGHWVPAAAAFPVTLGRAGSAWGIGLHPAQHDGPQKREGDGRNPAGVFAIGTAFGYAQHIDSAMPYQAMTATSYCMDVPDSPLYNRIVDASVVGTEAVKDSSEPMRLDLKHAGDHRYREGFVIEHNPSAIPGRGSCIFAHLWGRPGQTTAGCTAMEPADMQRLLGWLKPDAKPVFVLLPEPEYRRLQQAWDLPPLAEAAR